MSSADLFSCALRSAIRSLSVSTLPACESASVVAFEMLSFSSAWASMVSLQRSLNCSIVSFDASRLAVSSSSAYFACTAASECSPCVSTASSYEARNSSTFACCRSLASVNWSCLPTADEMATTATPMAVAKAVTATATAPAGFAAIAAFHASWATVAIAAAAAFAFAATERATVLIVAVPVAAAFAPVAAVFAVVATVSAAVAAALEAARIAARASMASFTACLAIWAV